MPGCVRVEVAEAVEDLGARADALAAAGAGSSSDQISMLSGSWTFQ